MSSLSHKIYIATLVGIVILVTAYLSWYGFSYYTTSLEERFYHPGHGLLKPSGLMGHGLGIVGTLLILIGVFGYMIRKRNKSLSRLGVLKYWLEFHIFLCTLGPIMVLFHTAFKFGGIVSISFWSMVAVVASGVIGRFIYNQIPRTIQGRELSLIEIKDNKVEISKKIQNLIPTNANEIDSLLKSKDKMDDKNSTISSTFSQLWLDWKEDKRKLKQVKRILKQHITNPIQIKELTRLIKVEMSIERRIQRLKVMQELFRYWHIAHLPFAIIMLVIMVIHVVVTLSFGYKWIF
ncbi:MAG: hypothetical protein HOP11_12435 [Saprospiraceae bacterium]|nr:hypothetical protein [Saprospiraceae bacterium]